MAQLTKIAKGHYRQPKSGFDIRYSPMDRLWTLTEHAHLVGKFGRMKDAVARMENIRIDRIRERRHAK